MSASRQETGQKVTVLEPDTRLQFWPHPPPLGVIHGWLWFIKQHPAKDVWKQLNQWNCYQRRKHAGS